MEKREDTNGVHLGITEEEGMKRESRRWIHVSSVVFAHK
jgi:hypothetical protein